MVELKLESTDHMPNVAGDRGVGWWEGSVLVYTVGGILETSQGDFPS